jgi:Mrp family chromosome partitioning ATPase
LGAGDGGRITLFVAATSGEGTSTVAREFARVAAAAAGKRRVWLVDADLEQQSQIAAVAREPERFGELGAPSAASPDGSSFLALFPPLRSHDGKPIPVSRLVFARPVLAGRLWLTGLRADLVQDDQTATIDPSPDYWTAMRRHGAEIVVDAPSPDRADTAARLAPLVDQIVLVVAAGAAPSHAALNLKEDLEAAGGLVAGLVFNRAPSAPLSMRKRGQIP